jgi:hypothetical protein
MSPRWGLKRGDGAYFYQHSAALQLNPLQVTGVVADHAQAGRLRDDSSTEIFTATIFPRRKDPKMGTTSKVASI